MKKMSDILSELFSLTEFMYNKTIITSKSIGVFNVASKALNDENNKMRENIIGAILNNKVPSDYYIINTWLNMKKAVFRYIALLTDQRPYTKVECVHKAGRKYNYDFALTLFYPDNTTEPFKLELKFNAASIDDTPQFVSPMKPSQYMTKSYEEYYYDNYLPKLTETALGLELPSKDVYLKQIHSNKPKCMKTHQDLYYRGCARSSQFTNKAEDVAFYESAKAMTNESISTFIDTTDLDIKLLSTYLLVSQKDKIYMLYSNNDFTRQTVCQDDYIIESVVKNPEKFRYECVSKSGKKINILLRWKNGNGIAFPAFQISGSGTTR